MTLQPHTQDEARMQCRRSHARHLDDRRSRAMAHFGPTAYLVASGVEQLNEPHGLHNQHQRRLLQTRQHATRQHRRLLW